MKFYRLSLPLKKYLPSYAWSGQFRALRCICSHSMLHARCFPKLSPFLLGTKASCKDLERIRPSPNWLRAVNSKSERKGQSNTAFHLPNVLALPSTLHSFMQSPKNASKNTHDCWVLLRISKCIRPPALLHLESCSRY